MKKYYKVTSINNDLGEALVVADDYATAVVKLMGMQDFDYLFSDGFKIVYSGEILV